MSSQSSQPGTPGAEPRNTPLPKLRLLLLAPAGALLLVALGYWLFREQLPSHLVRHAGPDGLGYSPTALVLLIGGAVAAAFFVIGSCCALDFWKHGHWYQTQKMIVSGFLSAGYAVAGLLLASLFAVRGVSPAEATSQSPGLGLLAFVLGFTAAIWAHIVLLPAGRLEEPFGS